MVHPGARKFQGGKKGPRQVNGKRQVKATLRPGPIAEPSHSKRAHAADADSQGDEDDDDDDDDDDQDGERCEAGGDGDGADYGYRQALRREAKPLTGFRISISGCAKTKDELWALAVEYGAERHPGLLANTTHLVTETTDSPKYRAAVQHNMRVMKPSWIWAVKQAWVSGDTVDYISLEKEHRWAPLSGVVACLTHFARGEHREAVKSDLIWHGARIVNTFTAQVTHLIVASPLSPHSQTPPSDKLLQARRNRKALHPRLAIVWEGWVKEAAMAGGPRPEETVKWAWREETVPVASVVGAAAKTPPEGGEPTRGYAADAADTVMKDSAEIVPSTVSNDEQRAANNDNNIGIRLLEDLTTLDGAPGGIQAPLLPEGNRDDLRVMKKRRVAQPALQHERDPELAWALRGPAGDGATGDLPNPTAFAAAVSAGLATEDGPNQDASSRSRKSGKTVIRALGEKRDETWNGGRGDDESTTKSRPFAAGSTDASGSGAPGGRVANQQQVGSSRREVADLEPVFAGQTMALMGLQGPDPDKLARVIGQYGGTARVDASSEQVDECDWIVVDYVEPDRSFFRSKDSRVVSVCWLELCIHHGELLQPSDRLLERPLAYSCPVPGADALRVHFSGYPDASPALHHIRRFMTAIGATYNRQLSRKTTHLVLAALDEPRYDDQGQLCDANPSKVAKAEEWGVKVISLRALRTEVETLAGVDAQLAEPKSPAKLAADSELRDVTNEIRSPSRAASTPHLEEHKSESPANVARSASPPAAASSFPSPPKSPVRRDSSSPGPMFGQVVDSPRHPSPEAEKPPQPEKKDQAKGLLRQQTSLLLAALGGNDRGGSSDVGKPRAALSRARSLRERSTETSFSARRPVDTQSLRQSPPPQATQDEGESVRIEYDDSEQAAARAQILKTLAQAKQAPRAEATKMADADDETPAAPGGGRSLRKRTRA